jgi:hypothetical protein
MWVAAGLLCVAAAAVAIVLATRGGDGRGTQQAAGRQMSIGPRGGTVEVQGVRVVFPAGAVDGPAGVAIRRLSSEPPLLPGARPVSTVYDVAISRGLRVPISISFRIPAQTPEEAALAVAHLAHGVAVPELVEGTRRSGWLTIRTQQVSWRQVLDVGPLLGKGKNAVSRTAKSIYTRLGPWLSYRGTQPTCAAESLSLESLVGGSAADPLVYARMCDERGRQVLKIANNRAFAWEFPIPDRARIERTTGRGFSETVWDEINKAYKSGWGILPAAGTVTLTGVAVDQQIALTRELTTLVTDSLLFVLTRGKSDGLKGATTALTAVQCAVSLANRAGEGADKYAVVKAVLADCAGLVDAVPDLKSKPSSSENWVKRTAQNLKRNASKVLKKAVAAASAILGAPALIVGIVDAFAQGPKEVKVSVRTRTQVIRIDSSGKPVAIGGFDIAAGDRFVSDAIRAFGKPSSTSGTGADECHAEWGQGQIELLAATYAGSPGAAHCDPAVEYVQDVLIRSPAFRTESGVHVGMSVPELMRLEPNASTRFLGDLYRSGFPGDADSTYRIAEMDTAIGTTGKLVTLAAHARGDTVVALEVTPLLGGD